MFKLAVSDRYFYPVVAELRNDKGRLERHQFEAEFKRLSRDEILNLQERVAARPDVVAARLSDEDLVHEVMTGWRGVQDENGEELAFTRDNLGRLLQVHPLTITLVKAFFDSLTDGRLKN